MNLADYMHRNFSRHESSIIFPRLEHTRSINFILLPGGGLYEGPVSPFACKQL